METTSSEELIKYLNDKGYNLAKEDKTYIRGLIFEITTLSYSEGLSGGNRCDCYQPSCSICN